MVVERGETPGTALAFAGDGVLPELVIFHDWRDRVKFYLYFLDLPG